MNAISSTSTSMPIPGPAAMPVTSGPATGDALADMRPSMDVAFAVGRPADAAGAATILGTASGYLQGAGSTIARLDQGIAERTRRLEQLTHADPHAAAKLAEQLDLLQRLRDRIQLSVERVSDILAGRERPDMGTSSDDRSAQASHGAGDASGLGVLEARRQLLAPQVATTASSAHPASVASAYSGGSSRG